MPNAMDPRLYKNPYLSRPTRGTITQLAPQGRIMPPTSTTSFAGGGVSDGIPNDFGLQTPVDKGRSANVRVKGR